MIVLEQDDHHLRSKEGASGPPYCLICSGRIIQAETQLTAVVVYYCCISMRRVVAIYTGVGGSYTREATGMPDANRTTYQVLLLYSHVSASRQTTIHYTIQ